MTVFTFEMQKEWLLQTARGVQADALLLGDVERYLDAAEVEAELSALSPEEVARLRVDFSCGLNVPTTLRIAR